ncbi:MAG TPA: nickel-type superoxide dismutase maturation protease [Acidimicrobiales bacterium]|nr:nickel-type superoxide dismutase maturation protease [Acidimicrobiales bacterium]
MAARQVILVTVVTALAAVFTFLRRVEVHGDSMLPTLRAGDRLLVFRTDRARPGRLVVVLDPRRPGHPLVKRVSGVQDAKAFVVGDNPGSSTDSAVFGAVDIEGRVLYRYHPEHRRGRVS